VLELIEPESLSQFADYATQILLTSPQKCKPIDEEYIPQVWSFQDKAIILLHSLRKHGLPADGQLLFLVRLFCLYRHDNKRLRQTHLSHGRRVIFTLITKFIDDRVIGRTRGRIAISKAWQKNPPKSSTGQCCKELLDLKNKFCLKDAGPQYLGFTSACHEM
jgi:hypothetical protein